MHLNVKRSASSAGEDAKIFKSQVQDLNLFPNGFEFPSWIINFLRGEEFVFSVDSTVFFFY